MSGTCANELLDATRAFLREEVLPELDGFKAYSTRVAANNLAIVMRELELGARLREVDAAAAEQLAVISTDGDITVAVARALREGSVGPTAGLVRWLQQRTLLAMAIDNPKYSGYVQARERWSHDRVDAEGNRGS